MRTLTMLIVAGLVALCFGAAHAETGEPLYAVLKTPKGYMVIWNESKSHFMLELPGQKIRQSNIEGLALFVDEYFVNIVVSDPAGFAAGEVSPKAILDQHMRYELKHWESKVGMPMPSTVHTQGQSQGNTYLLWDLQWPEQARQKVRGDGGKAALKQLFLSAVAGDRVVVVGLAVLEGESEESSVQYLLAVARSLVVKNARIDLETVQRQIQAAALADSRALAPAPADPGILNQRAIMLLESNRLDEALRDFDAALVAAPENGEIRVNRANLYMARGDFNSAIRDFSGALERGGAPVETVLYRGSAYLGTGALADARKDLSAYVAQRPDDKYGAMLLYVATARLGADAAPILRKFSQASPREWPDETELLSAVEASPEKAAERECEGHYYLGQSCLIRHDGACARAHFEAAVKTGLTRLLEYQGAAAELRQQAAKH
jgi:tetratricopeptide (TPR) repeat protein